MFFLQPPWYCAFLPDKCEHLQSPWNSETFGNVCFILKDKPVCYWKCIIINIQLFCFLCDILCNNNDDSNNHNKKIAVWLVHVFNVQFVAVTFIHEITNHEGIPNFTVNHWTINSCNICNFIYVQFEGAHTEGLAHRLFLTYCLQIQS